MNINIDKDHYTFAELVEIFAFLRSEQGCPWDIKQDHQSLTKHLLEEAYEVIKAVDDKDDEALAEELGDVLLQVVFNSEIAKRDQRFTIDDVIDKLARKLIDRHTHVFGRDQADDAMAALDTWQENKDKARNLDTLAAKLESIDNNLPQTIRSSKLQQKAAKVGFDWDADDHEGVYAKIQEELSELKTAHREYLENHKPSTERIVPGYNPDPYREHLEEEAGDLLMIVVNLLRRMDINPEIALKRANDKFVRRLTQTEKLVLAAGCQLEQLDIDKWNEFYLQAKEQEL